MALQRRRARGVSAPGAGRWKPPLSTWLNRAGPCRSAVCQAAATVIRPTSGRWSRQYGWNRGHVIWARPEMAFGAGISFAAPAWSA